MNRLVFYLGGITVALLGTAIIWNGNFQPSNPPEGGVEIPKQATKLSPEDAERAFNLPTATSTNEEKVEFAKFVDSLSQEITPIDITECNILPQISKIKLEDELRFINTGDSTVYILISPKKEKSDAIEVLAKQEYATSSVGRFKEPGWYKYTCVKIVPREMERVTGHGVFVVKEKGVPLNKDGEFEPVKP